MKTSVLSIVLLLTMCPALFAQNVAYLSTKDAISDLDFLINTIESVHYDAYFKTSKENFVIQKNQMTESWGSDSLSVKQFTVTGMKVAALLSNGHTALSWQNPLLFPELMSHEFIPFKFKMNTDGDFIISESLSEKISQGDQITTINGVSIGELFSECMSYIGGIDSFRKESTQKIFPLYLFFNEKIKAPYTIEIENEKSILLDKGLNVQELQEFLVEENLSENYTFETLDENIGYITYNHCLGYKEFEAFLSSTFNTIHEKNINKLIIDIRNNGGGNSSLNDLLLNYITKKDYRQSSGRYWKVSNQVKEKIRLDSLWVGFMDELFLTKYLASEDGAIIEDLDFELTSPKKVKNHFNGKTCLLIGAETFSSANFLADAMKEYNIGTVIGSPTGELTNDYGEVIEFQLPSSGSYLFVSSTYDIGVSGDLDIREPVTPTISVHEDALGYAIEWITKRD